MRKVILLICIICFTSLGIAQEPVMIFEDTVNDQNLLKITSFNTYSSNKFNNELMDKFLFGGEITTELKDLHAARLSDRRNAIGGEFEQEIECYSPDINLFKREQFGMKLSFSDNHYFGADVKPGLFNLAMYGNANYVGDTMDMSFSAFQYQHYQKFGVGFYHEYNMSSIQLNFITGSRSVKATLGESYVYTHPNIDSIDVYAGGSMFMTDRFFPYWAFQGTGFSVDIDYNFIFQGKVKNRQIINFKINNLGMIFWNKQTKKYVLNMNDSYSGFDIQDLLNRDTSQDYSVNWMDTLGITETNGSQIDVLPLELVVQKLPDQGIAAKWQAIFGFKAIMVPEYFPYLFAGVYYKPIDQFSVSTRASYGGFAGFRWGLNFNYWIKDKVYIGAGTFDMLGLFSKKIGFGRGFNFSMYFKLK